MAGMIWLSLWKYIPAIIVYLTKVTCESDGDSRLFCMDGLNFEDRCYWFSSEPAKWVDAFQKCSKYGDKVQLVVITSQKQQDWLYSSVPYRDMWIGLHDMHEEGHWLWVDGTYSNYTNWALSHPTNSSDHNCAMISHKGGHWVDQLCTTTEYYACSSTPNHPICHSGGLFFRDRCYWKFPDEKNSLSSAQEACGLIEEGAQVVIIRDGELNAFLSKFAHSTMWIGLSDVQLQDGWQWVDGSQLTFENWLPGEPNNRGGDEHCATMAYGTGGWNTVPCSGTNQAVMCALPPCSEDGLSDAGPCADESPYCTCVSDGYCVEVGKCHCLRKFHGMVCDKASVQVILRTASHVDEGEEIVLRCHVNIPKSDYSIQFEHIAASSDTPDLPEDRTRFFMEHEENGYHEVVIYNSSTEDTGSYVCVVSTTAGVVPLTRIDSAYVTVGSSATASPYQISIPSNTASGPKVAVAVLAIACILVIIAVIVLVLLARRKKEEPDNYLGDFASE